MTDAQCNAWALDWRGKVLTKSVSPAVTLRLRLIRRPTTAPRPRLVESFVRLLLHRLNKALFPYPCSLHVCFYSPEPFIYLIYA